MRKYQVLEDNGGGLTLAVFDEYDNVTYLHSDYEYNPGQLTEDLMRLKVGDIPERDWDGNVEKPQEFYDDLIKYIPISVKVVADQDGIYKELMGNAAYHEFFGLNVYHNAKIYENVHVYDDAQVYENA